MTGKSQRQKNARILRVFRKVHRITGIITFFFFFLIAGTGLLLGWKKHSGGLILAKSFEGTSTDTKDWLPIDSLKNRAFQILRDSVSPDVSTELDRIDIRPDKGMAKFVFLEKYLALQLDCSTGALLHLERRRADFLENIHDGSILDKYLKTSNGQIKLSYTTIMGLALLIFTITGFWLWYGPKWMRHH